MGRKELMIKSGGFDADFAEPGSDDRDFFLRLREITDFHYLDVCLGYYYFDEARNLRYQSNFLLYARKQWNNPRLQNLANDRLRDEFVTFCASRLLYYARLRLKVGQNKVSKEMVDKLNGFHESLKDLFGDSYKRVSHIDSIDLNRYQSNSAVLVLLYLYLIRPDLQTAFPEVRSGDLSRLAGWGIALARSEYENADKQSLLGHINELEQLRTHVLTSHLRNLIKAATGLIPR
jgi:hypothetical protein